MDENSPQQIDHYDYINAPQFVDFDDLAAQDDPDADKFFETHREEDDFTIPLDINAISPTVQLLYDEVHYADEANKAAHAAGLEDVKIEYYASPQQSYATSQPSSATKKSSITSVYGTPVGGSAMTSASSFYTPTGGDDKENRTPQSVKKTGSAKKASASPAKTQIINEIAEEKPIRNILGERTISASGEVHPPPSHASPKPTKKIKEQLDSTQSLYAQLEKLHIVLSDTDEEDAPQHYALSTAENTYANNDVMISLDNAASATYTTFSDNKLAFLDMSAPKPVEEAIPASSSSECGDANEVTLVVEPSDHMEPAEAKPEDPENGSDSGDEELDSAAMELHTPVKNILQKLDAELFLEDENGNSDDPRCSIVVAPSVGQQVHWNPNASLNDEEVLEDVSLDATEGKDLDDYDYSGEPHEFDFSGASQPRTGRASSVGDLPYFVEMQPKMRNFETFGYNPRFGITIPKTPDVHKSSEELNVPPEASAPAEKFVSSKNACYFEIEPPKHDKPLRRASSCSDLVKFRQNKPVTDPRRPKKATVQKKPLTIPRTPDTIKRSQRGAANKNCASNMSSASSTASKTGVMQRGRALTKPGPSVADRLAAARSRQPMKANHYVSMAEAMIKFQKNTPDRFRTLPRGRIVPERRAASSDSRKRVDPTPPHSPESTTRFTRSRNASYSEQTDKNVKINSGSGPCNLPKKVELKTTIPKPFNFGTSHRPRTAPTTKEADVVDYKFHARPAPKPRLDQTVTVKPKPLVKVTQPMSPHFASDDRLKERHQKKAQSATTSPKLVQGKLPASKVSKIPASTTSKFNTSHEHKTTVAQPFSSSFEARQKEILRRKEEKIKKELEEAKKGWEFHANPAPKFSAKPPKKKPVEVTHVEPFRLKSDERGAAYQEAFKKKVEEEEQNLKELAKFHAQPADVVYKPPFEPEKPTRIIEGPLDIQLATEKRAAEREQFDAHLKEKEREEEEKRREEQERLEELQRQEDLERRRQLVHKAQPFKQPKPFQLKSSAKPLTVPQSPAFSALPSERRIKSP